MNFIYKEGVIYSMIRRIIKKLGKLDEKIGDGCEWLTSKRSFWYFFGGVIVAFLALQVWKLINLTCE